MQHKQYIEHMERIPKLASIVTGHSTAFLGVASVISILICELTLNQKAATI